MACDDCSNTLVSVADERFNNTLQCAHFLSSHGVLPSQSKCNTCRKLVGISVSNQKVYFKCRRRMKNGACSFFKSPRLGTFVGDSKLPLVTILRFCLLWNILPKPRHRVIMEELNMGSESVVSWSNYCREVCLGWVLTNSGKIGGPGTIVEIDRTKMGQGKFNMDNKMDGQWLFGGVQRGSPEKFFCVPVGSGDKNTLIHLINEWIEPGTTIVSDCWKSYDTLQDEGFVHLRVNRSIEFVCTAKSGFIHEENIRKLAGQNVAVHLQNIQRKWLGLKYTVPTFGRKKDNFEGYIAEYIFRSRFQRKSRLHHFLVHAGIMFPPLQ